MIIGNHRRQSTAVVFAGDGVCGASFDRMGGAALVGVEGSRRAVLEGR